MQKVYYEVGTLDKRCYDELELTEDLLMENASINIKRYIIDNFPKKSRVLIVSGAGNNGADGIALARMLHLDYNVELFIPFGVKSKMALLQKRRADLIKVKIINSIKESNYDIILDAIFGTGLNKRLNKKAIEIITTLNSMSGYKIACDIPSGIDREGKIEDIAFIADRTITMGALKVSLFSDEAKEFVGEIEVGDLGVSREIYQKGDDNIFLLEKRDLKLPFRDKKNSHKGDFGHINIICGEKEGAALLSAEAGFKFGAGLATLISKRDINKSIYLMRSDKITKNVTSIAIGMGLGESFSKNEIEEFLKLATPMVIDADIFYREEILLTLEREVVLTPHPKEFVSLLKISNIATISVKELQKNRFYYIKEFSKKYPKVVLLLKGANSLIIQNGKIFINSYGSNTLSKGGSGDILTGLIASLLAQNYKPLEATISASLTHSLASRKYKKNNYSMTPLDLIEEIRKLKKKSR